MNKAILLSGGIDSSCLTFLYAEEIKLAITIDYGQRSAKTEINVSKRICDKLKIKHEIIKVNCSALASGEMSTKKMLSKLAPAPEWWPYRNQLLITLASMKILRHGITTLIIGTVKSDKRFFDGSKRFFNSINKCLSVQEGHIQIETPAIKLTTKQLVEMSNIPDDLLLWAHSCHTSNNPCGSCNGCLKYLKVMKGLGIN